MSNMYQMNVMLVMMVKSFISILLLMKHLVKDLFILIPYKKQSSYLTIDFVKRAIVYFGYKPQIIQTDNGSELTHTSNTKRIH